MTHQAYLNRKVCKWNKLCSPLILLYGRSEILQVWSSGLPKTKVWNNDNSKLAGQNLQHKLFVYKVNFTSLLPLQETLTRDN